MSSTRQNRNRFQILLFTPKSDSQEQTSSELQFKRDARELVAAAWRQEKQMGQKNEATIRMQTIETVNENKGSRKAFWCARKLMLMIRGAGLREISGENSLCFENLAFSSWNIGFCSHPKHTCMQSFLSRLVCPLQSKFLSIPVSLLCLFLSVSHSYCSLCCLLSLILIMSSS